MQANNRNLCKNKYSQTRNFQIIRHIKLWQINNYPVLLWWKNLTPVKSKRDLALSGKYLKRLDCQPPIIPLSKWGTVNCCKLGIIRKLEKTCCTTWAINLRFFQCLLSEAKAVAEGCTGHLAGLNRDPAPC